MSSSGQRMFFLDNLRSMVILFVVLMHGALCYMVYAPSWWYVVDTDTSLFFTKLVLLVDVPIMLIMFFLAGFFSCPSLFKRGTGVFLKDKIVRVGIPWVTGVLILTPPTAYMIYFSRNVPVSFLQFWSHDFWGEMFQQSVYWFLGILMLFFIVLSAIYELSPKLRNIEFKAGKPSVKFLVLFWTLMTFGFFIMNQIFPLDTWYNKAYIISFQPNRFTLYIGYFALGIYACHKKWFTAEGYTPKLLPWLIFCVVTGYLYLNYRFIYAAQADKTMLWKSGTAILFNCYCLSALMSGLALFKKMINSSSVFWRSLSSNSYGIYFIHPLILYPLAYFFKGYSIPLYLKSTVVIVITMIVSWLFSALVLKKVPVLRKSF